ncbi:MAG: TetR/AcrR family transcriptional regulator [Chloroflexota bacterium]|nr:TetR/AcrR family transcriptional regulator [Chloroflexota bacterium]
MAQQIRGDDTRSRLLAAAAEQFTQAGYHATSVREICVAAGVSKGAFYHHFRSKEAAFLALFDEWVEDLQTSLEAMDVPGETVAQRLEGYGSVMRRVFEVAKGRLPMFLEFWYQATRDPEVWRATIEPYRRFRELFAAVVSDGIAEGSIRPVDPHLAAHVLVSLAVGWVLQGVLEPEAAAWRDEAEDAVRLLLDGLAVEGSS